MNPGDFLKAKLSGRPTERNLFCPAVYEHKAKLIGTSISKVADSARLLEKAVLAEYEIYKPDMLTIGMDIYNIEAQALGAEVVYSEKSDTVPSIKKKILKDITQAENLKMPDISKAGRIPLFLEVGQAINGRLGRDILVRGALSGPYSIAAELMGIESLMIAVMTNPANVCKLLDFTADFVIAYGKEYIKRGISICMFDSQASPPLISPDLFKKLLVPGYQKIAREFKAAGCKCMELVIGGQTDSIAEYMFKSNFDIVLCDYPCDTTSYFHDKTRSLPLVRRNINSVLIEQGDYHTLKADIDNIIKLSQHYNNVIIGTGVISYNTPIENVLKIKKMCLEQ